MYISIIILKKYKMYKMSSICTIKYMTHIYIYIYIYIITLGKY